MGCIWVEWVRISENTSNRNRSAFIRSMLGFSKMQLSDDARADKCFINILIKTAFYKTTRWLAIGTRTPRTEPYFRCPFWCTKLCLIYWKHWACCTARSCIVLCYELMRAAVQRNDWPMYQKVDRVLSLCKQISHWQDREYRISFKQL